MLGTDFQHGPFMPISIFLMFTDENFTYPPCTNSSNTNLQRNLNKIKFEIPKYDKQDDRKAIMWINIM